VPRTRTLANSDGASRQANRSVAVPTIRSSGPVMVPGNVVHVDSTWVQSIDFHPSKRYEAPSSPGKSTV